MAKSESKDNFKVEYYEGDAEADAQHCAPKAKYFSSRESAEKFVTEVQLSSGSARKGKTAEDGFGPGVNRGWRLEDARGAIKEKPAPPPAPEPAPW